MNKMKHVENKLGLFIACIVLICVVATIGSSSNTPWLQMPFEAFNGIAFSFGYFFRLSAMWAYACSSVFFISLFAVSFWLGKIVVRFFCRRR
ncbi:MULTISPECIES: hypothetical protein [unclassified Photobacterium]|uniref:hypothetical protein n=1 Tax=unclassified Photobacterium TaxID=2628852 RepID=UPI000D169850|nr:MULTISPECIES: hypothetical protein [unclassified Photobacterium]PSV26220.1 hypothetical protein C9J42_13020 [Photobacterium sp. GB-56]PSV52223.1 hypothetical protein C9J45_12500 [Photobacterium sp. GB-1]